MEDLTKFLSEDKEAMTVPDLDWLKLSVGDKDNIPTPNNVQIIPQLEEAWSHRTDQQLQMVPNVVVQMEKAASDIVSKEAVDGLVKQAKKEMMTGISGKTLAAKLSSMYPLDVIKASKDELVKLSAEQGLLGNVYLDMTPFETCKEAAKILGKNKVRTAKYIVGSPTKQACSSHKNGYCKEMSKRVVQAVDYSKELLSEYTQHLRVAGLIDAGASVDSKDALREAFLGLTIKDQPMSKKASGEDRVDMGKVRVDLAKEMEKNATVMQKEASMRRFHEVRPLLAHMQNQMLRGKIGSDLKEALLSKYAGADLAKYKDEIRKIASLQGLMGNVYVDVSYYKTPEEAIKAIKSASTNPIYLVQTVKANEYDDTLVKVAKATGCSEMPRDGKVDKKIAMSYVEDLKFTDKISSDTADTLQSRIAAGDSVLGILRDAFMATREYKRAVRTGGVMATELQSVSKKATDRDTLKGSVAKALEAGISMDKVETKLASMVPTVEAVGMVRDVLAGMEVVDVDCLPKCTSEKYQFKYDARLKRAHKCEGCILKASSACTQLGVRFVDARDLDKAFFDLDPKTAKVLLEDNPDLQRSDMKQEYDMTDDFGSGMNIALNKMQGKKAMEIDLGLSSVGIDGVL